jgi:hypothetical protein
VVTDSVIGQVACFDLAFGSVSSKYVFVSEDNVRFVRKGFI